jgi:hypothetical protein
MAHDVQATRTACDCSALDAIDPVLREHQAASGQLVALTDEGMLCVVDTWPHACLPEMCCGHAWSDAEWAAFLEGFTVHRSSHHVTDDGRAVIPVVQEQLLWGAVIVDPGEACPDLIAAAVATRVSSLAGAIRSHS